MRVLLVHTDDPGYRSIGYADAWTRALEEAGCEVEERAAVDPAWAAGGFPAERWDLVVPHVLVEEVVAGAPTFRLAALLEARGARLLNPVAALVTAADKLATHAAWAAAGLAQPATHDLAAVDDWPAPDARPLVLKPAFCDGARHIALVRSRAEAEAHVARWREDERAGGEVRGPALLQEWIEEPACVRLFATPDRVSLAYEKSRHPGALVTHGTVYPRVYEAPPAMADLARAGVAALGGGLMGLDVLVDRDGRHLLLEANGPFGFDVTDPGQGRWVAAAAVAAARGRPPALVAA